MATHDYVISNASGASVRADLNNALAAIVSNNSNATSPATTYAYQWWADTTTGQLKLRNSANSAWITIFELDGTMLMEDGSVSAPGLAFASDLNTGFFRSAADKINFATGGAERLEIGSSEVVFNDPSNDVDFRVESNGNTHMLFVDAGNDRVGVGLSAPQQFLHVHGANGRMQITSTGTGSASGDGALFGYDGSDDLFINNRESTSFKIFNAGSERLKIDSSGRLLLGASSSVAPNRAFQIAGTATMSICANENSVNGVTVDYIKSRNTTYGSNTIVQDGDSIAKIQFRADDGGDYLTQAAQIAAEVDGTPGSNDMPGRLTFLTTADGASTPSERLRIDSKGNVGVGVTSGMPDFGVLHLKGNSPIRWTHETNGTAYGDIFVDTSNNIRFRNGSGLSEVMRLDSSGRVGLGTTSPAVLFHPSSTANEHLSFEDARHASFTQQIKTMRCGTNASSAYKFLQCESGSFGGTFDVQFILQGDGNALADGSFTGGGADYAEYFEWSDGNTEAEDRRGISVVLEGDKIREAVDGEEPIGVISGNPSVVGDAAWNRWNKKYVRDDYGSYALDENGYRQLNPDFDPDVEYVPREDRPEWGCVGLMGKLRIRKGQITGTRWIKMRDVSDTVEEWLVR